MSCDPKRKRRGSSAALSDTRKFRDELGPDDNPFAPRGTAGGPIPVTPIVVRPDWCLIVVDGRAQIVESERLYRLLVANAVACRCPKCAREARP